MRFAIVRSNRIPTQGSGANANQFEQQMLPHLDAAHNLARWLLRTYRDEVDDVVQESFLRAFRSFGGFRGGNARAWLLAIVRNTCYSLLKKKQSIAVVCQFDEALAVDQATISPSTIVQQAEDQHLVTVAIEALPEEFREVIILRHQENLSYQEIAQVLDVPQGTVMSRLARARAKLKEAIGEAMKEEPS